ncbi:MAG TPA: hypothetical protein VGP25_08300 [Gemmatimonadaceae bacterium]|jgi:hypothetical protein|nr:hypothetical protein [Gemmatimonadaceae bacterium]
MKRAAKGILLGVAITVGTLCLLEGCASALLFVRDYRSASAPKDLIRPHTTHDSLLGWVNRPSFASPNEYGKGIGLTTTALGFRGNGTADSVPGRAGEGVVCSGDSYTLGYGVSDEHTWCAMLESALPKLRTYNMGQSDYGLDQSALWYERDGHRVPHTMQLLGITNAQLERMTTSSNAGRFKPMLSLERGGVVVHDVPVPEQTTNALRDASRDRAKYHLRSVQAFTQLTGVDGRVSAAKRVDEQWPLVEKVLDDLAAANAAHGSRLVVAYLPVKRDLRPRSPEDRRRKLASYARRRGITFIDLTQPMRAMRPDSLDLSFISRVPRGAAPGVTDQYSNLGNAWIARALAARLSTESP